IIAPGDTPRRPTASQPHPPDPPSLPPAPPDPPGAPPAPPAPPVMAPPLPPGLVELDVVDPPAPPWLDDVVMVVVVVVPLVLLLDEELLAPPSVSHTGSSILGVWTQPVWGSQLSSVQYSVSLQSITAPGTHTPKAQVSGAVQRSPSSQGAVLKVWTQ